MAEYERLETYDEIPLGEESVWKIVIKKTKRIDDDGSTKVYYDIRRKAGEEWRQGCTIYQNRKMIERIRDALNEILEKDFGVIQ